MSNKYLSVGEFKALPSDQKTVILTRMSTEEKTEGKEVYKEYLRVLNEEEFKAEGKRIFASARSQIDRTMQPKS